MTPRAKLIVESVASLVVVAGSLSLYLARLITTRKLLAEEDVYFAAGFVAGAVNTIRIAFQIGALRRRERETYHSIVIPQPEAPPMAIQDNDVRLDMMIAPPTPLPPLLRDANGGLRLWVDRVAQPQREGVAL